MRLYYESVKPVAEAVGSVFATLTPGRLRGTRRASMPSSKRRGKDRGAPVGKMVKQCRAGWNDR